MVVIWAGIPEWGIYGGQRSKNERPRTMWGITDLIEEESRYKMFPGVIYLMPLLSYKRLQFKNRNFFLFKWALINSSGCIVFLKYASVPRWNHMGAAPTVLQVH